MTSRARELETLLLVMFAAVPLYLTRAAGTVPLLLFHAVMAAIAVRVALGRGPELVPARLMRWLAVAYVPFYVVDAWLISGSAISASTHLVLFIAVYQPIEAIHRNNHAQRLLTAALIFIASLSTSTHISVVFFVGVFAFLMFRQLLHVSHLDTARSIGRTYAESPSSRAAAFYLVAAAVIAAALFPLLPRLRTPMVQGITAGLPGSTTGLSESIDFREQRNTPTTSAVVARVWMSVYAKPFFSPVRLKGTVYDRYERGEWRQTLTGLRQVSSRGGVAIIARPEGVQREAVFEQRPQNGKIFLPVGTFAVDGLPARLYEGPARNTYYTYADRPLNLRVRMAYNAEPLRPVAVAPPQYPIAPAVRTLALSIVGTEQNPRRRAQMIAGYLSSRYRYVANPADLGRPASVDEFLLRTQTGHCEYFAAGMVVLLTALDVPSRIVGGFYGGRENRLTGYYTIRREDAHAWTEVWDGERWMTFDPTPVSLRPGAQAVHPVADYLSALSESLTFLWDRYVLTFGLADQVALVTETIAWARERVIAIRAALAEDAREVASFAFILAAALLAAVGAAAAMIARRRRPLFDLIAAHLAAHGIEIGAATTMEDALRRLGSEQPDAARQLEPVIAMYEEERFSGRTDLTRVSRIRRRLQELRA